MDIRRKLAVLADAARYDAPCARRTALPTVPAGPDESLADAARHGICEVMAADGRKIPLLKVLFTNHCVHDCAYCVNRRSADVERARFEVQEIVRLMLDLFRRGLIEGLFLSSGVERSADHAMERLVAVARTLRRDRHFAGYIHLKAIPEASAELIAEAGRWSDRLSVNVELPTQRHLDVLAPGRRLVTIARAMDGIRDGIAEAHEAQRRHVRAPAFAPAGQVTQMVVGADDASDAQILHTAASLYTRQRLRRVYYGSYIPIADPAMALPEHAPSPQREHRLYQADWLLRHYGFAVDELVPNDVPNLPLDIDPKLAWALRHREAFPVDVNRASPRELLRVPGFGATAVGRIVTMRRWRRVRTEDLLALHVPIARALPFIVAADRHPAVHRLDALDLRARLVRPHHQLDLFAAAG